MTDNRGHVIIRVVLGNIPDRGQVIGHTQYDQAEYARPEWSPAASRESRSFWLLCGVLGSFLIFLANLITATPIHTAAHD
jgi:hypothetical protein